MGLIERFMDKFQQALILNPDIQRAIIDPLTSIRCFDLIQMNAWLTFAKEPKKTVP